MRRSWMVAAAGAALLTVAPFLVATAADAAPRATSATEQTVVRPVTSSGHPVAGYSVQHLGMPDAVDCSGNDETSPSAVDDGIVYCSPSAAAALACWRAAAPHHVYCLLQADRKRLTEYPVSGSIGHTTAPSHPAPLDIKLTNGVFCGMRDGGAGATLRQHHSWHASYYCTQGKAVWAADDFGVHRGTAVWTVQVASDTGKQHVHTARVARAWFVGTAA